MVRFLRAWWREVLIVLVALLFTLLVMLLVSNRGEDPTLPRLSNRFSESPALRFAYPEDWIYDIPRQGLIVVAPLLTFEEGQGPALTIERFWPGRGTGLEAALETYLERGPLREGTTWQQQGEAISTSISGRDALLLALEGAESPEAPVYHSVILITRADNGYVYVIVSTAPVEMWPALEGLFAAVRATLTLAE